MGEDNVDISLQVAYNLSSLQIQEVFRLLQLADNYLLRFDYHNAYNALVCCKLSAVQSFTKEERDTFANLESKGALYIKKDYYEREGYQYHNFSNWYRQEEFERALKKIKGNLKQFVEMYKTLLHDTLEAHGYLIKKMEDFKHMF